MRARLELDVLIDEARDQGFNEWADRIANAMAEAWGLWRVGL